MAGTGWNVSSDLTWLKQEQKKQEAKMLTVRNVSPSGHEEIVQGKRVSFSPNMAAVDSSGKVYGGTELDAVHVEAESGMITFTDGSVYVMNDTGKTVAIYSLWYPGIKE